MEMTQRIKALNSVLELMQFIEENLLFISINCLSTEPLSCGSPDSLQNTTVVGRNFTVGNMIEYKCPKGHALVGNATRKCERTGMWSDLAPTCKCKFVAIFEFNQISIIISCRYRLQRITAIGTWKHFPIGKTNHLWGTGHIHLSRKLYAYRQRKPYMPKRWLDGEAASMFD